MEWGEIKSILFQNHYFRSRSRRAMIFSSKRSLSEKLVHFLKKMYDEQFFITSSFWQLWAYQSINYSMDIRLFEGFIVTFLFWYTWSQHSLHFSWVGIPKNIFWGVFGKFKTCQCKQMVGTWSITITKALNQLQFIN